MGRTVLLISHTVLEAIKADAARFVGRRERGGILLGLRRGPHIHVIDMTLPMRWDMSSLFAFRRSSRGHREIALRRWKESDRTMDWVGEWHSHPQAIPSPSVVDLKSWRAMTTERQAPMVFLIVGYEELWVGLCFPSKSQPIRYVPTEASIEGVAFEPIKD